MTDPLSQASRDGAYHTIIGLPRSGKTTFLAALWHLLDAGEVSTRLVLDRLIGDHQYLNAIVAAWRRCEEVPRTSLATETDVVVHVREQSSGRRGVLAFPDLAGESFHRQVAARTCRQTYVDGLSGEGGVLLFLTADRPQDGVTIADLAPILAGAEADPGANPGTTSRDAAATGTAAFEATPREWRPADIPEQVQLVELLQFLQRAPFRQTRRQLAVVVSAWDVVLEPRPTPEQWLARELPLLAQFLTTNAASFATRVYGVSAQGGNVRGDTRARLLRAVPSERVACVGGDADPHDITAPIHWLMTGT